MTNGINSALYVYRYLITEQLQQELIDNPHQSSRHLGNTRAHGICTVSPEGMRGLEEKEEMPSQSLSSLNVFLTHQGGKSLYTEIVNEACFESLDDENRTFGTTESEVVLVSTDASKRNSSQTSRVCRQREGRQQTERLILSDHDVNNADTANEQATLKLLIRHNGVTIPPVRNLRYMFKTFCSVGFDVSDAGCLVYCLLFTFEKLRL
ncbi:hypothetical protein Q9233_011840 [Columba guinea]|nr:hypothetical protein Q9233_011840 [Columba guinea]